jgi:hypothetical protein
MIFADGDMHICTDKNNLVSGKRKSIFSPRALPLMVFHHVAAQMNTCAASREILAPKRIVNGTFCRIGAAVEIPYKERFHDQLMKLHISTKQ